MTGTRIDPSAEMSAIADPEIPPNNIDEKTFTTPRPPRTAPTADCAKRTNRIAMPPWNIRSPAKMKNGIAINGKTFTPAMMR